MRRSRYREEQIIGILKEHQAGLPAKVIISTSFEFPRKSSKDFC